MAQVWETTYLEKTEKQCRTEQQTAYRQACNTVYKNSCQTVNEQVRSFRVMLWQGKGNSGLCSKLTPGLQVCTEQYRQESQPYSETECQTTYERQCESTWQTDGYGGKQWVEDPSTCQNQPQKSCQEVTKQNLVQVRRG